MAIAIVLGGFGLLGGAVFLAITFFGGEGGARGSTSGSPRQPRPGFVPAPLPAAEDRDASAAIRMSLGSLTTPADIDRVAELFPALIQKARGLAGIA